MCKPHYLSYIVTWPNPGFWVRVRVSKPTPVPVPKLFLDLGFQTRRKPEKPEKTQKPVVKPEFNFLI